MNQIKLYFLTGFLGSGKTTLANILAKFYEIPGRNESRSHSE